MELRHLKYFLMVAQELSFTQAAKKLFISQPPLSRQIKELEDEIGARLLERNNKKVKLTDAGSFFEKEVHEIFKSLEQAMLKTKKIALAKSGDFKIGYIASTFSSVLSDLLNHLSEIYPFVTFKLYEASTYKQITALEQGKLDLGILRAPFISPKLESKVWFSDTYSLAYNKEKLHILSERDIEKLKDEVFVFYNKEYAPHYYHSLLEICSAFGISPNVVHESNSIISILQLVKNGLGVSIVPSSLAKTHHFDEIGFVEIKRIQLASKVLLVTPKGSSEISDAAINYMLLSK